MDQARSDEELVLAARSGSRDAFGILLARHRPLLLGVCRRALRDDGLAEDAAQEAALQALLSLDRLRRPERFASWLAGIGLNLCHRQRRLRSRDAWSWEAMLGGSRIAEPVDAANGPEELAEAAELRKWIADAVDGLPPGQRAAVILHYLSGLTQAETAEVLSIEVGAVKTRLHKARANLRRDLLPGVVEADSVVTNGERTMIEMRLSDVRRRLPEEGSTPRHIVILEEVDGPRRLTIWIGEAEAVALALELEKVPHPRPLTYAFAANMLQAASGRLREVRIDRLDGEVFFASAVIDGPSGQHEVDARPSDALNLAILLSAPIRVHPEVLAAGGGVRSGEEWTQLAEQSEGPAAITAAIIAEWEAHRSTKSETEPA
jgi:RNA polymerase sigma factor (sigma-70 family)